MSDDYFPNLGAQCFSSSLANLLLELGDIAMAERVFMNCTDHPLWSPEAGVRIGLVTRVLSDLTCQKYEGTFTVDLGDEEPEHMRSIYGERTDEMLRIIDEEKEKGSIKSYCGTISFKLPAMLMIPTKKSEEGHWIVCTGESTYIDNGKLVQGPPVKELEFPGVLEVRLNGSC